MISARSIRIRLVRPFPARQTGMFPEMLRAQRFGNHMPTAEPFAEVNQPATARAKRPVVPDKPVAGFFADRTFDPANALIGFRRQWF